MSDEDDELVDTELEAPAPASIEIIVHSKKRRLTYESAFALGCSLIKKGQVADAARLFERLEEFTDRGPRAFIMQAFCEAARLNMAECSRPLKQAFHGEEQAIATALHNAFVSYHVGIRDEALKSMIGLVNEYRDLPTLCLLLGDMLQATGQLPMARKCWSLAVHRDRPGGAVAAVALRQLKAASPHSSTPDAAQ